MPLSHGSRKTIDEDAVLAEHLHQGMLDDLARRAGGEERRSFCLPGVADGRGLRDPPDVPVDHDRVEGVIVAHIGHFALVASSISASLRSSMLRLAGGSPHLTSVPSRLDVIRGRPV